MFKTWERFLVEKNGVTYDFSSTQIQLPSDLAKAVMDWGKKNIPDSEIHADEDGGKGREDDIHVTLLYGLHAESPDQVKRLLADKKSFEIELGETSIFSNDVFDVVKIGVKSPELHKLNALLSKECDNSNSHPKYIPHVTVAYVKPGKGKKYIGRKDFVGKKFRAITVVYSSSNGKKTPIGLSGFRYL